MPEIGVYSATRAAINHLTKILAAEYGPQGIRVNAVALGFTVMAMTKDWDQAFWKDLSPSGRVGPPDEIASVVAFIATKDAR